MIARGLDAYRSVDVDSAILSASSVELIVMLYDGAMTAIQRAKGEIGQKNFAAKAALISRAVAIVAALRDALNEPQGGEIAVNLKDLYLYIEKALMEASLNNSIERLDECHRLMAELHEAWAILAKSDLARNAQAAKTDGTSTISYGKV